MIDDIFKFKLQLLQFDKKTGEIIKQNHLDTIHKLYKCDSIVDDIYRDAISFDEALRRLVLK
jgi:hypothetical protein